jgi:hypothetical protein
MHKLSSHSVLRCVYAELLLSLDLHTAVTMWHITLLIRSQVQPNAGGAW